MRGAMEVVQHGDQHENDVYGQAFEMSWRQVNLKHRNRGHDLPVERGGLKGIGHVGPADRVVDDIKTGAARMRLNIVGDSLGLIVNGRRPVPLDDLRRGL